MVVRGGRARWKALGRRAAGRTTRVQRKGKGKGRKGQKGKAVDAEVDGDEGKEEEVAGPSVPASIPLDELPQEEESLVISKILSSANVDGYTGVVIFSALGCVGDIILRCSILSRNERQRRTTDTGQPRFITSYSQQTRLPFPSSNL